MQMRVKIALFILCFFACSTIAIAAASASSQTESARINDIWKTSRRYRCPIATALYLLKQQQLSDGKHPYVVLEIYDKSNAYQQCMFYDDNRSIHCEAASGFYYKPFKARINADTLNRLQLLGYETDGSKGNFVLEQPVPDFLSLFDLSEVLLKSFVEVYGMKPYDIIAEPSSSFPLPFVKGIVGNPICPADNKLSVP